MLTCRTDSLLGSTKCALNSFRSMSPLNIELDMLPMLSSSPFVQTFVSLSYARWDLLWSGLFDGVSIRV